MAAITSGRKKTSKNLSLDAAANFFFSHTYLSHDFETALILKAFRDLLVVNDEYCGQQKKSSPKNSPRKRNPPKVE